MFPAFILLVFACFESQPHAQPSTAAPGPREAVSEPDKSARPDKEALLKEVSSLLIGTFSSAEQHAIDPEHYFDIRLRMVPIWADRTDGVWLYVEQAAATNTDKPYRQRVYHVTITADGKARSEVYQLPGDPLVYAGASESKVKTALLEALRPRDLALKEGCAVELARLSTRVWEGGTTGKACASERGGAAYATATVLADDTGLVTWDRGMDKDGKQVWGVTEGGYRFKRIPDPPRASSESVFDPAGRPPTSK
ncbi:MAG: chromophore lyase CpcT/CpeT [Phycisphaerae bacterium]|nr:chromophore lyase CpcT/CpeT [Phycisphaerae bacterium]